MSEGSTEGTGTDDGQEGQGGTGGQQGQNDGQQQGAGSEPDWKARSRDWETKAKRSLRETEQMKAELEELRTKGLSEQEKAIKAAREEGLTAGRTEAMTKAAGRLVAAEARAALSGRGLDAERLAGLVDDAKALTRLVGEDGEPDAEAIAAWADRVAPKQQNGNGFPDLGQGRRGSGSSQPSINDLIRAGRGRPI